MGLARHLPQRAYRQGVQVLLKRDARRAGVQQDAPQEAPAGLLPQMPQTLEVSARRTGRLFHLDADQPAACRAVRSCRVRLRRFMVEYSPLSG